MKHNSELKLTECPKFSTPVRSTVCNTVMLLTKVQKGVYHSGIKVFNCLPTNIKSLSRDVKKFKLALRVFLLEGSFYTIQEFLN